MPLLVFDLLVEGNIARAVRGERIGTLVTRTDVDSGKDRT
jgi:uridylate kinase